MGWRRETWRAAGRMVVLQLSEADPPIHGYYSLKQWLIRQGMSPLEAYTYLRELGAIDDATRGRVMPKAHRKRKGDLA